MRYIMFVSSRAVAGREEDYDRWYEEIHRVEMCQLPGILSCSRFRQLDMQGKETGEFIAQYEVETDDPAILLQSVFAAVPTMRLTDAVDPTSARVTFLKPIER